MNQTTLHGCCTTCAGGRRVMTRSNVSARSTARNAPICASSVDGSSGPGQIDGFHGMTAITKLGLEPFGDETAAAAHEWNGRRKNPNLHTTILFWGPNRRAGAPATVTPSATSATTTDPAPITTSAPIRISGRTVTRFRPMCALRYGRSPPGSRQVRHVRPVLCSYRARQYIPY